MNKRELHNRLNNTLFDIDTITEEEYKLLVQVDDAILKALGLTCIDKAAIISDYK